MYHQINTSPFFELVVFELISVKNFIEIELEEHPQI